MKGELDLLWICLIILFTVSTYVGSVLAYLTGLFTNSYLLDAKIMMQFALAVVPVLIAETLYHFITQPIIILYCRSGSSACCCLNDDLKWAGKPLERDYVQDCIRYRTMITRSLRLFMEVRPARNSSKVLG